MDMGARELSDTTIQLTPTSRKDGVRSPEALSGSLPRRLMNGEPIILRPAPTGVSLAFQSARQAALRQMSMSLRTAKGEWKETL